MKKVVVISWVFPPTPGIGGRRWVKFAKWMHRKGADVQVLAVQNFTDRKSTWMADLSDIQDRVKYSHSPFSTTIGTFATTFYQKVRRRLVLGWLQMRVKGNHYDRAALWGNVLRPDIDRLAAEGYDNFIITAGPFHATYYVAEYLKAKHPNVKVTLDFRDPWTTNKTSFGIDLLSAKRVEAEKELEKRAVQAADTVVTVSPFMLEDFAKTVNDSVDDSKYQSIANGFDFDDVAAFTDSESVQNMRMIFTGSLYDKSDHGFGLFKDFMTSFSTENDSLNNLKADFYGNVPDKFKHALQQSNVRYNKSIPLNEVYAELANSQACMLFLTDDINYSISTKFCEYLALGKPVVVFSKGGATAELVESHGLGISVSSPDDFPKLAKFMTDTWQKPAGTADFDLKAYSVEQLAVRYLELLQ